MTNKREIIRNLISFGAIDILGLLIPIITMPILTRALGANHYGELLLVLTMLYFGHTIIDYGTQFTATRKLARSKSDKNAINIIYSDTQSLRLMLCLLYLMCMIIYCMIFSLYNILGYVGIAGSLYLIGYTLNSAWFFQGIGAVDQLMKVSIIVKIINLAVILFFVKSPEDLTIAVLASCVPTFIGGVYLTFYIHLKYKLKMIKFENVFKSLKEGKDVFIGLLAPNMYNMIPTIALGTYFPASEFASFAIASRLSAVVITIQDVVAKAIYPILSRIKESQVVKLLFVNGIVSILPICFLYFFGDWVLNYFLGSDFSEVNQYLVVFVIGVLFTGLSNAISTGFLLPKGLDQIYRRISLNVSIFSCAICIYGIYSFGLMGGAISITIARILFFICYLISYNKLKKRFVSEV